MTAAYTEFLASKAIAAGRRAHGSELEPKYFAAAAVRMAQRAGALAADRRQRGARGRAA